MGAEGGGGSAKVKRKWNACFLKLKIKPKVLLLFGKTPQMFTETLEGSKSRDQDVRRTVL